MTWDARARGGALARARRFEIEGFGSGGAASAQAASAQAASDQAAHRAGMPTADSVVAGPDVAVRLRAEAA